MGAQSLRLMAVGAADATLHILSVLQLLRMHDSRLLRTERASAAVQLLACLLVNRIWSARVALDRSLRDLLRLVTLVLLRRHGTTVTGDAHVALEATDEGAAIGLHLLVAGRRRRRVA